jgi:transposase
VRIARETLADPAMPIAFKRAQGDAGPDETHELMSLWHKARRSILTSRQHLLNEAECLLRELPEELRDTLPDTSDVRPRLKALAQRRPRRWDPATDLRLQILDRHTTTIADLDGQDREAATALKHLARQAGSTLSDLCGIVARIEAELLVEVGDPRRFTGTAGFARFNGTAPLPASSGEGDGEPVRHRLNRGGNRRVNARLHRIAVTQLRCEPRTPHDLRHRPCPRPHQEGGHAHPHATPQRRRLPPHDRRPTSPPSPPTRRAPTNRLT